MNLPQLTTNQGTSATAPGSATTSCRCSNSTAEDALGGDNLATLSAVTSPTALWPPQSIGGDGGGGGGCEEEGLSKRIVEMEEEQEELNNSLMEMTSHFAKVHFHLFQSPLYQQIN